MYKLKTIALCIGLCGLQSVMAVTLNLDSCRSLALQNNHQLEEQNAKVEAAKYTHKAARTNFYPQISATGTYMRNQKEISLLNNEQKYVLDNTGNALNNGVHSAMQKFIQANPDLMNNSVFNQFFSQLAGVDFGAPLTQLGQDIKDAFRTDTRNIYGGLVTVKQPVYMGGKIVAYNKITKYAEDLAESQQETNIQEVLLETDKVYWQVVSLSNKEKLAKGYLELLQTLDDNVEKLIAEGVATKADGLTVKVKMNEAEMQLTRVENGLNLSRMLLCQVCGIDLNTEINLVDESLDELPLVPQTSDQVDVTTALLNRPELHSLSLASSMYNQKVNVVRSEFLPNVALVGNYLVSNPNLFNGFENKFSGTWNVGVVLQVPICHWGEGAFKVKAAKAEARAAKAQLHEAEEKITLQVNQSYYQANEAAKKLIMANKNKEKADENLRYANIGFEEGVIPASNVLEAHTAWLSAQSEKIDAQIEMKLADTYLQKALGKLGK